MQIEKNPQIENWKRSLETLKEIQILLNISDDNLLKLNLDNMEIEDDKTK